jgi:hypothetical protein
MSEWTDHKGRSVEVMSMTDRWLNNIRKMFRNDKSKIQPILDEIQRRKQLRSRKKH